MSTEHNPTGGSRKAKSKSDGKDKKGGNRNQPIVSCLECRRMKWRCDRQFPCSHCRRRGIANMCPDGLLRPVRDTPMLLATTHELQKRIEVLEAELHATRQSLPQATKPHTEHETSSAPLSNSGEPRPETGVMAAEDVQLTLGDEPGSSFFFGSAGTQFILGERETAAEHPLGDRWSAMTGLGGEGYGDASTVSVMALLRQVPEPEIAAHYAEVYFEATSFMNYILEREALAEILDRAYAQDESLDNQQLAIAFLVLAIGASIDLNYPPYNTTGERLFNLGRAALDLNPAGSIFFVQAINLMSRYIGNSIQKTSATNRFWTVLGTAVRCAQSLGLHRDGEKWGLEPEVVELRRRVFWEIYTEDILHSVTQGRPRLVSDATIDCQFPSRSEGRNPTLRLCHDYKYRLVRLMGRINDQQTQTKPVPYSEILDIHNAIREAESDFAAALRGVVLGDDTLWQRLWLQLLVHEGLYFLHRAHFVRCLKDHPAEPLSSPFRYSYVSELESSRAILDILREALSINRELACRHWVFFFHAFNAIINFAGVVISSPLSSLAPAALGQVVDAVELFETLPEGIRAREDLPTLGRVLQQAQDSFASQGAGTLASSNILGTGHTLVRRPRRRSEAASSTASVIEHPLPETLDEAVAVTDFLDMFNIEVEADPMSTGQLYDWFNAPGIETGEVPFPTRDDEFGAFIASLGVDPFVGSL